MTRRRDKQTIAVFLGLILSTTALAESMEDRTVNHLVRQTGQLEQDDFRIGSALLDDQVLTAETPQLLKVGERDRRYDRGRGSYRGRGKGDRGRGYAYRRGGSGHYGYGRPYRRHRHDYYYGDGERLLWYGLGVLTPYVLDDRFYY